MFPFTKLQHVKIIILKWLTNVNVDTQKGSKKMVKDDPDEMDSDWSVTLWPLHRNGHNVTVNGTLHMKLSALWQERLSVQELNLGKSLRERESWMLWKRVKVILVNSKWNNSGIIHKLSSFWEIISVFQRLSFVHPTFQIVPTPSGMS